MKAHVIRDLGDNGHVVEFLLDTVRDDYLDICISNCLSDLLGYLGLDDSEKWQFRCFGYLEQEKRYYVILRDKHPTPEE